MKKLYLCLFLLFGCWAPAGWAQRPAATTAGSVSTSAVPGGGGGTPTREQL